MSEWITDRRPTDGEVGDDEYTMGSIEGRVFVISGRTLREAPSTMNYAWMPRPEPYKPTEPDTSLSASIERGLQYIEGREDHELLEVESAFRVRHLVNILEAARKWDEIEKKDDCVVDPYLSSVCNRGTKSCYRTHDDIGESEHGKKYEERTGATSYNELFGLGSHPKDPSMMEPEAPVASSGDKPQTPVVSSGDKEQADIPDTPIERVDKWLTDVAPVEIIGSMVCDIHYILNEARKWDELLSAITEIQAR